MDKKLFVLGLFVTLNLSFAHANDKVAEALKAYKTGDYLLAIETLEKTRGVKLALKSYIQGLAYNRLQKYDLAIPAFEKSIRYKHDAKDLYFEYGQALYANSDLEKARDAFKQSFKVGFNTISSLYYVGHVNQLLEEHREAKKAFQAIIKRSKDDKKMRQVARFQMSESLLAMAEKKEEPARLVEKYVIPQMEKVVDEDKDSSVGKDATAKIEQLKKRYYLDPSYMKNGKVVPEKRWDLSFTQQSAYDNNVTLSTDVPTSSATRRGSYIYYSTFAANYKLPLLNRFIVKPNFEYKNTYHSDRVNTEVFTNDAYSITTGLDNSYEHTLFGQRASLLMNYSFNYIARDNNSVKERQYTSRAHTLTLGEKFKFFKIGQTGLKVKYKDYSNFVLTNNNRTRSVSLDQLYITPSAKLWIFFFQADFLDAYNNENNSTNNYLFRVDYINTNFLPTYTLNLAASVSFLDTKLQSATRGTEKTYTPSAKLTKTINKNLAFTASYEFTKNSSKDKTSFDYTKHVTTFELKVTF